MEVVCRPQTCGLERLAIDRGALQDIVHTDLVRSINGGIVIRPDDPVALAQAVAALFDNPPSDEQMTSVATIIAKDHNWTQRVRVIEGAIMAATQRARP